MKSCFVVFIVFLITVLVVINTVFNTVSFFKGGDIERNVEIHYVEIPSDYMSVGGYSADMSSISLGDHSTNEEWYNWSAWDVFWPGKECVRVGNRTESIRLYFKEGYRWENNGSEYCLVKD